MNLLIIIIVILILLLIFGIPFTEGFDVSSTREIPVPGSFYFYPPTNCYDTAFGTQRCFDNVGYPYYLWNAPYWSGYRSDYFLGKNKYI